MTPEQAAAAQAAARAHKALSHARDRERTREAVIGHVQAHTGAPRQQALVLVEAARQLLIEANQHADAIALGEYINARMVNPNADCG